MTNPTVNLLPLKTYDRDAVLDAVTKLLHPLGGMEQFVSPGSRVLLKPNLVFGRAPERAVNTHPEILRAAAVLARRAGAGSIVVGDSPGFGSAAAAVKACGIQDVADEEGLEIVEFTPAENHDGKRLFHRLELAREALGADVIINLPKMKTHGQMLMTLAVKNMFGAVPGARKLQWHYRAGRDRLLFARAINEIALTVLPRLSILDAVTGMDEMGPTAGRARDIGFVAASDNPWSLDAAVMDVLGLDRDLLFTLAAARQDGLANDWENFRLLGVPLESLRPGDWRIPELVTLQMHGRFIEKHLPKLAKWLRKRIAPRPVPTSKCNACGYCVSICPAKAMRIDDGRLKINEAECIRCFCCHELCQREALHISAAHPLARLLGVS